MKQPLNRAAADEIFLQEAIILSGSGTEGIALHRIVELFGQPAADFMSNNMRYEGHLVAGKDYNVIGSASKDRPLIHYLYKSGFLKVVAECNYLLTLQAHKASEGGSIVDALWKAREERLAKEDAADEARKAGRASKIKSKKEMPNR